MTIKAKFRCDTVSTIKYSTGETLVVTLGADYACADKKDNIDWSEYTPSGSIEMTITQKGAYNAFKPGKKYYVTFEEEA